MLKLSIKVVPGASRDCLAGWLDESLKVCVKVAPEKGKANKAVKKLIAQTLGIPASHTKIILGNTSAHKVIEISGLSESAIYKKPGNTRS